MHFPHFALVATFSVSVVLGACTKGAQDREHTTHSKPATETLVARDDERQTAKSATTRSEGEPAAKGSLRSDDAELAFESVTLGGDATDSLPWVVALHGLGDTPGNFLHLLRGSDLRAHVYALRAIHPYGDGFDWYDARVTGDQAALSRGMNVAVDRVAAWIRTHAGDPRNQGTPVVFGFSQGGMLSFALATQHPDLLRAAVPVSGLLPKALWPGQAPSRNIPILALHGTEDRVIPIEPARDLVVHLKALGFDASLTEFDGVAHSIPPQVHSRLLGNLALHLR